MRKRCTTMMLFFLAILWLPCAATAATVALPATGQTGCWDVSGAAISCAGTGQDGDKLKGAVWPTPRFADNGDQTMTDNLTGLMWTQTGNPAAATKTWQGALDYVATLNSGNYLGHNDWRLPNRKELTSMVNRQEANSATWLNGQGFSNVDEANYYWSSSSYAGSTAGAWYVGMSNGYVNGSLKTGNGYVWPVRAGQSGGFGSLAILPVSKDFGSVTISATSAAQTFTITNSGTATLIVSSIAATGGDSAMFTITPGDGSAGSCGATPTLALAASCTISATFTPTSFGAKSTTLRIASNDPATPKDVALSGTGVLPTYAIGTGVVGGNGTISCATPVTQGNNSVCTISPDANYHLATFTDNTVDKLSSVSTNSYTISNVTAGHTIAGTFAIDTYTVSFTSGGNGTLSGTTSQTIDYGASASAVTAVPASGYHFVNWTGTGGFVTSTANPLTVANVTAAQAITANFAVDVIPVPHDGIINPADGKTAPTISDALALLNHLAGITTLTSDQLIHADVAPLGTGGLPLGNGVIDFSDVIIILRRAIGIGSW